MRESVGRLWRLFALAGGALLTILHAGILWRRVADGTLLSPLVTGQWLVGGVLLLALLALRRRGVSVFQGRSGVAFWIVVALMHCIVALPGGPGFLGVLDTAPATAVTQLSLGLVAGALALGAGLMAVGSRSTPSLPGFGSEDHGLFFPTGLSRTDPARGPPA